MKTRKRKTKQCKQLSDDPSPEAIARRRDLLAQFRFTDQVAIAIRDWNLRDVAPLTRVRILANEPLSIIDIKNVANAFLCSVNHI